MKTKEPVVSFHLAQVWPLTVPECYWVKVLHFLAIMMEITRFQTNTKYQIKLRPGMKFDFYSH